MKLFEIFKDRDGRYSLARFGMFWTLLIATAFFAKAFYIWGSIPEGIIGGLGTVAGSLTMWNAATKFSKADTTKE